MFISESLRAIEKIKAMPEEEKKALAKKLDEWTINQIKFLQNLTFSSDDISMSNISMRPYYFQTDDIFLYHYLLGLPLYVRNRSDCGYYCQEIQVRSYKNNGKPFTILSLACKEEFEQLYADIVTKEEPIEEETEE